MKRLQIYETPGVTVTFDPNICQHTGVCLRGLPQVFDIREKRWVRPELAPPEEVIAQVDVVRRAPCRSRSRASDSYF